MSSVIGLRGIPSGYLMYSLTVLDLSSGVFYGNIGCQVTTGGIQNQINDLKFQRKSEDDLTNYNSNSF